ncbi:hypothetical protein BD769DRAFT_846225 [Suillus cothurnatus]|nr:hypothetical protein BD769DRAFT_846225 [Suillus cothurnatus]
MSHVNGPYLWTIRRFIPAAVLYCMLVEHAVPISCQDFDSHMTWSQKPRRMALCRTMNHKSRCPVRISSLLFATDAAGKKPKNGKIVPRP